MFITWSCCRFRSLRRSLELVPFQFEINYPSFLYCFLTMQCRFIFSNIEISSLYKHPIEVPVNIPFIYCVVDRELDLAIIVGRIINPLNSRIQWEKWNHELEENSTSSRISWKLLSPHHSIFPSYTLEEHSDSNNKYYNRNMNDMAMKFIDKQNFAFLHTSSLPLLSDVV